MKIVITGGHITPALSVIDFIQHHHPEDTLVFVGREFSQDALQQKAVERYEIEKRGIPFLAFDAVRLGPTFTLQLWRNLRRFFTSLREAKKLLKKQKPAVIVSFGGYVAVPFALAGWALRIPVVTHEQTMTSGFANTLIGCFAHVIALSFPHTRPALFRRKTIVTGNPLRAGVFAAKQTRPDWLPAKLSAPLILVMGGNQGSRAINTLIGESLPELLPHWTIVHQCGQPTADQNAHENLLRQKNRLDEALHARYHVREWIDEADLFWLYHHAFCALSRAGANSVMELAAARVPSILVPLPHSRRNEQQHNADWLMRAGGAIVIDQRALTPSTLLAALDKLKALEPTMRKNLAHMTVPANAAEQVYAVVSQAVFSR